MPGKVWDEITYPFTNLNGAPVDVWEWTTYFIPHFWAGDYLFMLELKLIHASKRDPLTCLVIQINTTDGDAQKYV